MDTTQLSVSSSGLTLAVTRHRPLPAQDRHRALLYFHGGGLLYGERDDLPQLYLDAFLARGYTLFCFDYPLAPETPLADIHHGVLDCARWFLDGQFKHSGFKAYFLFGRSAGAYLALILAKQLRGFPEYPSPSGILGFYGYYDLHDSFFSQPSAYYDELPPVPSSAVDKLTSGGAVTAGPMSVRFSLYVYARQTCRWIKLLRLAEDDADRFSLRQEDIARLPPLFITASSGDQDVPMRISKALSREAAAAHVKWVYYLEHDFDRDTQNPTGLTVYHECLDWMDQICTAVQVLS